MYQSYVSISNPGVVRRYDDSGNEDAVKDEKSQLLLDHSLWIVLPGKKSTSAKGNNSRTWRSRRGMLALDIGVDGKTPGEEDTGNYM